MSSILETREITKAYPGTVALDRVSVSFKSGEVSALVGKNGCGKSTLLKIFAGAEQPTNGEILIDGQPVSFGSPGEAYKKGIAIVYQELSLVPYLTVAENILLERLPMKGKIVDWKKTYSIAKQLLEEMNIDLSPKQTIMSLSMWQCQMVEIAKAMSTNPKVLLLDEPTSSLAQNEVKMLFKMIRELKKKKDVIIVYVSHRLEELWKIADTCTVLRDGHYIGKIEMENAKHEDILRMMFGNIEIHTRPEDIKVIDEIALEVKNLTRRNAFENISFQLKKGEILGIAGMLGSGRTELLRSIFGADDFNSGEVFVKGKKIPKVNLIKMKQAGLAMTPEDRQREGLVKKLSIRTNLIFASFEKSSPGIITNSKNEDRFAKRQIDELQIKLADWDRLITSLSGGNQQKVVVGNWLNTDPEVMFFDEPSRGIDVNAKQQIFQIIWSQARKGISSIIVSSELEELLEVCHRILILRHGKLVGEVLPENLNVEELYSVCMGGQIQ